MYKNLYLILVIIVVTAIGGCLFSWGIAFADEPAVSSFKPVGGLAAFGVIDNEFAIFSRTGTLEILNWIPGRVPETLRSIVFSELFYDPSYTFIDDGYLTADSTNKCNSGHSLKPWNTSAGVA
jgi:hypothetical protein